MMNQVLLPLDRFPITEAVVHNMSRITTDLNAIVTLPSVHLLTEPDIRPRKKAIWERSGRSWVIRDPGKAQSSYQATRRKRSSAVQDGAL